MYNPKKSDSPLNAKQVYINGKRYRSLSQAAADTELTFCYIANRMAQSKGAPVVINGKTVVTEKWLLNHPDQILLILEKNKCQTKPTN